MEVLCIPALPVRVTEDAAESFNHELPVQNARRIRRCSMGEFLIELNGYKYTFSIDCWFYDLKKRAIVKVYKTEYTCKKEEAL